jgi:hypothetical protein
MKYIIIGILACALVLGGCQTKAQTGALVGGVGGAAAGAAIGHAAGNTAVGAVIGGAAGAGGGYLIGKHMEKKNLTDSNYPQDTTTVNVTNSDGTTTPVVLTRRGNVWVGPNNETYDQIPTPQQLQNKYGH